MPFKRNIKIRVQKAMGRLKCTRDFGQYAMKIVGSNEYQTTADIYTRLDQEMMKRQFMYAAGASGK